MGIRSAFVQSASAQSALPLVGYSFAGLCMGWDYISFVAQSRLGIHSQHCARQHWPLQFLQYLSHQPRDAPQPARDADAVREDKLLKGIDGLVTNALKVGGNPVWYVDKRF